MTQNNHTFLVELGTEELPPASLRGLSQALGEQVAAGLSNLDLTFSHLRTYATPRRLAVLVEGLPEQTPIKEVSTWGPPVRIAFDAEGKPTKAAHAFAAKNGMDVQSLSSGNDGKADKLVAITKAGGESVPGLMPAVVQQALGALPISKRMRWGATRDEFVRPVHWLVMLFDQTVVPCEVYGCVAGDQTRGHRFHKDRTLTINHPTNYVELLREQGQVVADFGLRSAMIREQVNNLAKEHGGIAVIDEDLLEEVTALVEWPVALAGRFDESFLKVPAEALILSMKEHQKYFHLVDDAGQLLPLFITISNIESEDPAQVIAGNEKVIRPRLADAAFFFTVDKSTPLAQQREKLRNVVFQAKLGSVFDKTDRVAALAKGIAQALGADQALAERAGQLSKADLVTTMVYEFADMQGIAGYYYALNDGEPEAVAKALHEQYMPRFAKDTLPETSTGVIIALADRLDTLVGIFGIGQVPSGSKDPFALRRVSLAVLRLLVEKQLDLDLRDLLKQAAALHPVLPKGLETIDLALNYMLDRFRAWYEEAGVPIAFYQAVNAKDLTTPLDINNRVYAVEAFWQLPEAEALAGANKRVSNILAKQGQAPGAQVDTALLQEPAEQNLHRELAAMAAKVTPLIAKRNYREALAALAQLRQPVDSFFDDVMVMTDDEALRDNRLALLQSLRDLFWQVADISCLAGT